MLLINHNLITDSIVFSGHITRRIQSRHHLAQMSWLLPLEPDLDIIHKELSSALDGHTPARTHQEGWFDVELKRSLCSKGSIYRVSDGWNCKNIPLPQTLRLSTFIQFPWSFLVTCCHDALFWRHDDIRWLLSESVGCDSKSYFADSNLVQ